MRVEPPYAPPYEIHAPQVPPPRPAPGPFVTALAAFLNNTPAACWLAITVFLWVAGTGVLWLARSLFFSDAGLYAAAGLAVLIAAPRLCLTLLVIGGMVAVAAVDQVVPRAIELITHGWPLALALAAVILALLVERIFFR